MSYQITLDNFEGPLDLLLHLIRKNEMDIYDIPIVRITEQYLATIDAMKSLNLDVAGEFLLMAASLIHIKSRMLLPSPPEEEISDEEEDPRAELVRRLLEYQKYKDAATSLGAHPILGRDVFTRIVEHSDSENRDAPEFEEVGIFELVEALREILRQAPEETFHEITQETLSVTDRVNIILSLLSGKERLAFTELFNENPGRDEIVVTFLAMLELVKLRLVRLMQNNRFGSIWLFTPPDVQEDGVLTLDEDSLGYA